MNKIKIFNSFDLKVIAFITMIIDHIGYFLYYLFDSSTYYALRGIGRISMPIFVFLIYQGFKHTSNLKEYFKRLVCLASITQIIVLIMGIIAWKFKPGYGVRFYFELNIVFSFALGIIVLYVLDSFRKIERKEIIDYVWFILTLTSIAGLYLMLPLNYGILPMLMFIVFYTIDKLKEKDKKFEIYVLATISILLYLLIVNGIKKLAIFALPILILYNGQKGTGIKRLSYYAYLLQFIILFGIGILLFK